MTTSCYLPVFYCFWLRLLGAVLEFFSFLEFSGLFYCLIIKVHNLAYFIQVTNGEGGIWTLAPLLTTYSLSRGAPSASWVLLQVSITDWIFCKLNCMIEEIRKRRRWDSNPRPLSESLVFKTSSLNHSDTSPLRCSFHGRSHATIDILSSQKLNVNN